MEISARYQLNDRSGGLPIFIGNLRVKTPTGEGSFDIGRDPNGIRPERVAPGKPHQNGAHERMHPTLKQETASPPARTLAEQIARFDPFQETYNEERPHETLGQIPSAVR